MVRYTVFTCAKKLTKNQLSLTNEGTKKKNRDAQKKRSSHKVHVVSPEAGRESTVDLFGDRL